MFREKKIEVYKIKECSVCHQALEYLRKRDVSPVVYLVEKNTPGMTELVELTRCSTFPQIFVDSVFIGGLKDLKNTTIDQPTEFRMREMSGEIIKPMCREEKEFDRFILFNGKTEYEYADIHQLYKKQTALFWVVEEIDLSGDSKDWEDASDNERHFLKLVLAFFASLDQIVMENIGLNFKNEIVIPQIRNHFAIQEATEAVHGESYALLIQTYFKDMEEQRHVMRSVQTMPIIEKKALWAEKLMNPETASLAERLIGFTCLEGVQFSGSFCAIYWLKKQQKSRDCLSPIPSSRETRASTQRRRCSSTNTLRTNCLRRESTRFSSTPSSSSATSSLRLFPSLSSESAKKAWPSTSSSSPTTGCSSSATKKSTTAPTLSSGWT